MLIMMARIAPFALLFRSMHGQSLKHQARQNSVFNRHFRTQHTFCDPPQHGSFLARNTTLVEIKKSRGAKNHAA